MKVLHVLYSLKFSGAEIMYVDAASEFQEKGCKLSVMAIADELGEFAINFEKAGYDVLHYPIPPSKKIISSIKYFKRIIKVLKEEQFDVIHIHSSRARLGFSFCAWKSKISSVYTFHSVFPTHFFTFPYHCFQRWLIKNLFKCKFQSISDSVYNHELKFYRNKTTKIYNWYSNLRYYPAKENEKELLRRDLGISSKTLVLISVGGCNEVKRHSEIIKALSLIKQVIPDVLYLHLGEGCSGTEERNLAEELGVNHLMRFCGNQLDVRKFLIASDIYIMTSRFEGISITTIEAMACKIPTILYDVQGLRDFNKEGNNSFLIPEDFRELSKKVIEIRHEKSNKALNVIESANKLINDKYKMQNNVSSIYNLYYKNQVFR
ncbi:MAG: glycosyltransferase family 4 protein [Flavobacterium sp.]|uniref:glycosyltransferase family 4 protein n=1 Tax=Flavobacterium sp. TaxID=239 RepID=UPI001B2350F5|nr:glycosyltransferase family 4 protein [Flavobacterium sp.]MBO9584154.1 glycosyltransferase family 4 protein [Flavobacterium sp.]